MSHLNATRDPKISRHVEHVDVPRTAAGRYYVNQSYTCRTWLAYRARSGARNFARARRLGPRFFSILLGARVVERVQRGGELAVNRRRDGRRRDQNGPRRLDDREHLRDRRGSVGVVLRDLRPASLAEMERTDVVLPTSGARMRRHRSQA